MENWVEAFSLSWCVPVILNSVMAVANGIYDYFIGSGLLQMILYGYLAFSIGLYLVKMYLPKEWLELFGFSGGGEMYKGEIGAADIAKEVFKPMLRTAVSVILLLQIKPVYITEFVINPFLKFGEIYTSAIINIIDPRILEDPFMPKCDTNLEGFLNKESCETIMRPMGGISRVNGNAIMRGFDFISLGGFSNIAAGIGIIAVFFSINLSIAFTLIRGIFKLGMAIMFYPFRVIAYVIKKNPGEEYWFSFSALSGIINSLRTLVVAMISVMFLVVINILAAGSMLNFDLDKTEGLKDSGFTIVSTALTLWIIWSVFKTTKEQMNGYIGDAEMTGFYDRFVEGRKTITKNASELLKKIIKATRSNG